MGDVWDAPEADAAAPGGAGQMRGTDDPLDPMAVSRAVADDFKEHIAGYFLSGTSFFVAILIAIVVVVAVVFVPMLPGLLLEDETLAVLGALVGFSGYIIGLFGLSWGVVPLMTASLLRAFEAQRIGTGRVTIMSPFDTMFRDMGRIIGFYVVGNLLTMVGILFLYLPGLVVAAVVMFALPIVVFDGVSGPAAMRLAWAHMKENASWHFAVWLIGLLGYMVVQMTVVGILVLFPVMAAYQLYAYRTAFGEAGALGTAPV